jgi:hypothetical protein
MRIWALCNKTAKKNFLVNINSRQITIFGVFLAYRYNFNFFGSFPSFYCKESICSIQSTHFTVNFDIMNNTI